MKVIRFTAGILALTLVVATSQATPVYKKIFFSTKHSLTTPKTYRLRFSLWNHSFETDEAA